MVAVAIGWEIYERTHQKMALGNVGLALVLPVLLFSLAAGHFADRHDRRFVCAWALGLRLFSSLGLAALSFQEGPVAWMYACLVVQGTSRAFMGPARSSLFPQLLPMDAIANGVTWNSGGFHIATVIGPAVGGVAIAAFGGAGWIYVIDVATSIFNMLVILSLKPIRAVQSSKEPATWASVMGGLQFVFRTKVILAAVTLDLFAVLLGGATALLPVYASDILHVDATGLGWLRAAPALGAVSMAGLIAYRQPMQRAGVALLWSVAIFGVATIVFGYSEDFTLSMGMLILLGAVDQVSVQIRHTLITLRTPDEMRGRVAAVNSVFISSSNQLGEAESGYVAEFFGPVASVVSGGIGTLIVVLAAAIGWPELRRLGKLEPEPSAASDEITTRPAEGKPPDESASKPA